MTVPFDMYKERKETPATSIHIFCEQALEPQSKFITKQEQSKEKYSPGYTSGNGLKIFVYQAEQHGSHSMQGFSPFGAHL